MVKLTRRNQNTEQATPRWCFLKHRLGCLSTIHNKRLAPSVAFIPATQAQKAKLDGARNLSLDSRFILRDTVFVGFLKLQFTLEAPSLVVDHELSVVTEAP